MKRTIAIQYVLAQVIRMIGQLDHDRLCELYNMLSSKDYVEYYGNEICTVNDKMENAS